MFSINKKVIIRDDYSVFAILIGKEISSIRKSKGISGTELGKSVGLSQQQISRYERGVNRLDLGLMMYLLHQLDISFNDFISRVSVEVKLNYPSLYRKYQSLLSISDDEKPLFITSDNRNIYC